jgi:uncharacterized membrane protein
MSIFEWNDLPIKRFLILFISIQILLICLLGLGALGINIPFITQVIGLVYALFIPGIIILRILRLHQLGTNRTIIYSVGISACFLMFLGFVMNFAFPMVGMPHPLAKYPIIVTTVVVMSILCLVAFLRDKKYATTAQINWDWSCAHTVYVLILLPLLAVLGAQLVNIYQSNILLMCLMALLALIPIVLIFTKYLPRKYFGLAIWVIALSLLLHRSLISQYLWGADIVGEFASFRMVEMNSVWLPNAPNLITAYNVTLSVTILPVMISKLTSIEGLWVFKLIFPIMFSLAPLAIYEMLRGQFSEKTAFLAAFFAMSIYTFYTTFLQVDKQLVATLLLASFSLLMLDRGMTQRNRTLLLAILGMGVIVSHYSTAFLWAIIVAATVIGLLILHRKSASLTVGLAVMLVAVSLLWYGFMAHGAVIKQFVSMGGDAVRIESSTVNASAATNNNANAAQQLLSEGSVNMPNSMRYLYIITQVLMTLGFIIIAWRWIKRKEPKISDEFLAFTFLFLCLLVIELILPEFGRVIALDRIYFVCLIFLSPFFIVGIEWLLLNIKSLLSKVAWKKKIATLWNAVIPYEIARSTAVIAVIILTIFFLANTGFIYELAGQPLATSIALNRNQADFPIFSEAEFSGARWLTQNDQNPSQIFYDNIPLHLFMYLDATATNITGITPGNIIYRQATNDSIVATDIPSGSDIFLRDYNIKENKLSLGWPSYQTVDIKLISIDSLGTFTSVFNSSDVIYTDGESEILNTTHNYSTPKD